MRIRQGKLVLKIKQFTYISVDNTFAFPLKKEKFKKYQLKMGELISKNDRRKGSSPDQVRLMTELKPCLEEGL